VLAKQPLPVAAQGIDAAWDRKSNWLGIPCKELARRRGTAIVVGVARRHGVFSKVQLRNGAGWSDG
jgi:hypothetical protein